MWYSRLWKNSMWVCLCVCVYKNAGKDAGASFQLLLDDSRAVACIQCGVPSFNFRPSDQSLPPHGSGHAVPVAPWATGPDTRQVVKYRVDPSTSKSQLVLPIPVELKDYFCFLGNIRSFGKDYEMCCKLLSIKSNTQPTIICLLSIFLPFLFFLSPYSLFFLQSCNCFVTWHHLNRRYMYWQVLFTTTSISVDPQILICWPPHIRKYSREHFKLQ